MNGIPRREEDTAMTASITQGIQLAEGYQFTDRLTSPYRLAYGHISSPCSAIYLSNLDGSQRQEVFGENRERTRSTACFSADGSTMYFHSEQFYSKDLATGTVRALPGIPQDPPFDDLHLLECSPDNRVLLFTQTATPQFVRGSAPVSPVRLCRVRTDGTDFRVLYEDSEDFHLSQTVCCWQQGFVLLHRTNMKSDKEGDELWKVDIESGNLELSGCLADIGWHLTISPDGKQIAWSDHTWRGEDTLSIGSFAKGLTEQKVASGTCPAWSPDGKKIAFMKEEYALCLLDVQSERTQSLVWFEPPNLTYRQRGSSYAVTPVWSPDGRLLWFCLTQTRKLPPPRSLPEALRVARYYIYPIFHNLNPKRTSHFVAYKRHYSSHRTGILDFDNRQVMLSNGFHYGVVWLPGANNPQETQTAQTGFDG